MTTQEEDKLLHDTEVMFMRNKHRCKGARRQKMYGIGMNLVHRERACLIKPIDEKLQIAKCICGEIVKTSDEPFYCSKCGQRLSTEWGWTVDDYYNEKKTGALPSEE